MSFDVHYEDSIVMMYIDLIYVVMKSPRSTVLLVAGSLVHMQDPIRSKCIFVLVYEKCDAAENGSV